MLSKGRQTQKNGKMWEFFQGTKKIFISFVVLWLVNVGIVDFPPLREKFPLYPVFLDFFLENEHLGTPKKLTLSDQTDQTTKQKLDKGVATKNAFFGTNSQNNSDL